MSLNSLQVPTDAYHPIITNLTEERKNFQSPGIVLNYLQNVSLSLPNKFLSEETALNLTKVKPSDFCAEWTRDGSGMVNCQMCLFFFFFFPYPQHAEVPRARDQILATAVTMLDP